jgi:hypothetical protein
MTTRWKGNFINFSIELYFYICSVLDRGEIHEKRQQGDDKNKKEEMVMTTLKRMATNHSIKHTRSSSEV